jgi:hypothetical protein
MSFESKRLRVQLPCSEGESVKEVADVRCPFDTRCRGASFFCAPDTCSFGEHSRVGPGGLCQVPSRPPPGCPGWSDEPFDRGAVLIDPEQLPVLREQLMEQLKEIDAAEEELRKRGSGDR